MRRPTLSLFLITLATPSLAQGLPAVEGEGSQTQSIELLQDSVTITLDSSGSVSLGRGNDAVSGSLGVSVNDLAIGNTSSGAGAYSAPSHGDPGVNQARNSSTDRNTALTNADAEALPAKSLATGPADDCNVPSGDVADLSAAVEQGYPVALQEISCSCAASQVAQFAASSPAVPALVEAAGIVWESVVAITFNNDTVTVYHNPSI